MYGSAKAFWIYLLFFPSLFALADDLSQYNGEFRLAKEIELKPIRLQALMRYFTIPGAFRGDLTETMLNAYLDDFDNLQSLPKETREKLVQGLEADLGATFIETQKIVDAQGKPASLAPPSVRIYSQVTDTGQSSPNSTSLSRPAFSSAQLERTRAAQATVRERWTRLTNWDKVRLVDLSHIDPLSKAAFAAKRPGEVKPSTDIPLDIRIVLRSMNWHGTPGGLEFKDDSFTFKPEEFLGELSRFGDISGMSAYLRDPLKNHDGESSLHIHISTVDESRDLTPLLQAINHLFLLRFIEAGESEAMFSEEGFGFNNSLNMRGILRMITKNHFEIRTHLKSPEQELSEVLRWLSLPERDALKEIYSEAKEHLENGKILDSLLQDRKGVVASYSILARGTQGGVDLSSLAKRLEKKTTHAAKILKSSGGFLRDLAGCREVADTHPEIWRRLYRKTMTALTAEFMRTSGTHDSLTQDLFALGDAEYLVQRPKLVEILVDRRFKTFSDIRIHYLLSTTRNPQPNAPPNQLGRLLRNVLRKRLTEEELIFRVIHERPDETIEALMELDREDPSQEMHKRINSATISQMVHRLAPEGGMPHFQIIQSLLNLAFLARDPEIGGRWQSIIQEVVRRWDETRATYFYNGFLNQVRPSEDDLRCARALKDLGVPTLYNLLEKQKQLPCRTVPSAIE